MLDYYIMNRDFIKQFSKMNFDTDDIQVAIMLSDNRLVYEQPIQNLRINTESDLWTLKADKTVFDDVAITNSFYIMVYNKTIDNTIITSTSLQPEPDHLRNDVTVSWNTASGIIQLKNFDK